MNITDSKVDYDHDGGGGCGGWDDHSDDYDYDRPPVDTLTDSNKAETCSLKHV